jgi:hypothetical protein
MLLHPLPPSYPRDPAGRQTAIPDALFEDYVPRIGLTGLGLYLSLLSKASEITAVTALDEAALLAGFRDEPDPPAILLEALEGLRQAGLLSYGGSPTAEPLMTLHPPGYE